MSKPEDVSQSDWDEARVAFGEFAQFTVPEYAADDVIETIARAILAEREACRWVAAFKGNNANMLQNDNVEPEHNRLVRDVSFEIASAIRNRTQA